MQTSTHDVTIEGDVVRKRFLPDHDARADREWACLGVLADHAPGLAPVPLTRETDKGLPVVVMERVPGEPLGPSPLLVPQTLALGAALRRLYAVPVDAARAAGIEERRYFHTDLSSRLVEWLADEHDLGPCQQPDLVARAVGAAREWLADPALPDPRLTVLGIADLNPANVLWDGQAMRLVDFEDGPLSDPAFELADHLEHLGGRHVYDQGALIDAVGLDGEERGRLAAYRPLWAAFWLALLMPGTGAWDRNPPGTTEAQAAHFMGLVADL